MSCGCRGNHSNRPSAREHEHEHAQSSVVTNITLRSIFGASWVSLACADIVDVFGMGAERLDVVASFCLG